jgi:predicted RecA/RadA family phage recombinase
MKNFIQPGDVIDWTNSTGAVLASGAGVLVGTRIGVAAADIANTATGSVRVKGVVELPKLTTDAPTQGALLYWDNTNKRLTITSAGNTLAGYAAAAAANGATTVYLHLNA